MSVEDWANRQATRRLNAVGADMTPAEAVEFREGILHAFSALLSDEAVTALAEHLYDNQTATTGKYQTSFYKDKWDDVARAALQAAVDAVTKGDNSD